MTQSLVKMERRNASMLMLWLGFYCVGHVAAQQGLPCSASMEGKSCDALAMLSVNSNFEPSIADVAALFQLKDDYEILGANNWPPSLSLNTVLQNGAIVRVPIRCGCSSSGTGIAEGIVYTAQSGDSLSVIAVYYYGGLVSFQDIASYNNISDPQRISVNQKIAIPIPCSCSAPASGVSFIDYTYIVGDDDTLSSIASELDSSVEEIQALNGNISSLIPGGVIGIPLKACSSNFSKNSTDQDLLVANGTYAFTAERCVQCSCGPNDLKLYCTPGPQSDSCKGMQCENSNLTIGNMTTDRTSEGCNVTECLYNGYINNTVATILENYLNNQCPVQHVPVSYSNPPTGSTAPSPSPEPSSSSPSPSSSPPPNSESPPPGSPAPRGNNGGSSTQGSSATPTTVVGILPCILLPLPFLF